MIWARRVSLYHFSMERSRHFLCSSNRSWSGYKISNPFHESCFCHELRISRSWSELACPCGLIQSLSSFSSIWILSPLAFLDVSCIYQLPWFPMSPLPLHGRMDGVWDEHGCHLVPLFFLWFLVILWVTPYLFLFILCFLCSRLQICRRHSAQYLASLGMEISERWGKGEVEEESVCFQSVVIVYGRSSGATYKCPVWTWISVDLASPVMEPIPSLQSSLHFPVPCV